MSFRFGIRTKLFAPLLMGLVVVITAIVLFWQPSQLEDARQQFIETQIRLVKTLNPSIIQNVLANDLAELYAVFENSYLIHADEWRYIRLSDPNHKQLYPIFSEAPQETDMLLKMSVVIEENNEIFGYVDLYADWELVRNKKLEDINQLSILAVLLMIVIGILSYIFQTRWIYQPIIKLNDIAVQFSKGNYSEKVSSSSSNLINDEIDQLAHTISDMGEKIKTSLSRAIDNEKLQRAILDSVPDAIITIDKLGDVLSFNPGAEKIFQYAADDVIGNNIQMLMPEDVAGKHDKYLGDFESDNHYRTIGVKRELSGVRKDGSQFPMLLTINDKVINNDIIFTGILRDITDEKEVDRLKNDFVSTVSHELRTPLTAIKGSLDIITKGLNLDLPDQARVMLDISNRNVERLLTLINDILDVSKLESGEINFMLESLEMRSFLDSCLELNQEYAKKFNTEFVCIHSDDSVLVIVDKDRLTQVMSNLLSNAAKYSPENVPVEVFTDVDDGKIRVSVKDYGPGIPEEFQPVLFEKFTQSSSGNTRQVGGTGLGLNISKMIVEKLGGEIGFETIVGKQTIFYFELPVVAEG